VKPGILGHVGAYSAANQGAFAVGMKEWKLPPAENVFVQGKRPKKANARERRLESGQRRSLLAATNQFPNPWIR
jgi:hypothetical protein